MPDYPIQFDVDRAPEGRNRLTVAFRVILVIPIAIVLATVSGGVGSAAGRDGAVRAAGAGGLLFAWFSILFTGRYPNGAQDFVVGVMRWHNRVIAYALTLVTDRYPPFRLAP